MGTMNDDLSKLAIERALAAGRLQKAWMADDREAGLAAISDLHAGGLRALLTQGDDGVRDALRTALEVSTTAVLQWWFSPNDDQSWRRLLLPDAQGRLPLAELASNAAMLRLAGSEVVDGSGSRIRPEAFANTTPARQARALAHVCLTSDAASELDYAALFAATCPELRPFLSAWLLSSYLTSPGDAFDEEVAARQAAARRSFGAVHAAEPGPIPAHPGMTSLAYRALLGEADARPFLEALDAAVLRPAISTPLEPGPSAGLGVFLEGAGAFGKIDRRVGRTLEALRLGGARGVLVGEDVEEAYANLPSRWHGSGNEVVGLPAASTIEGLAASAASLAEERLDLLVYPQVSLGVASRWLSSQRLARVQVTLTADLATSGSAEIDYAIVGEDLIGVDNEFAEDVLVVPGLGFDITPPPLPTVARQRGLAERECLLVSSVTSEKLSGPLLDLWNAILERSSGKAALHFFPSLSEGHAHRLEASLASHFGPRADALLVPRTTRADVIDTLVEADLYLDAYPYGGLHSLVEALASGCPVLTLEGDLVRNRVGAALLRKLDLPEFLIARTGDEYVEAASTLIADPGLRADLRSRLRREAVLEALIDPDLPEAVTAALELARQLGPRTQGQRRAPRRVFEDAPSYQALAV
jgi:hypothetical protein